MYTLNTVEDAFAFLTQPDMQDVPASEISLQGELAKFETVITGEKYHATIPAALARGLWEFQEEMYRAAAFALYGEDNIRRLTDEQKRSFELVFSVSEGSSDIWSSLGEFFKKLGEGFTTMDSKHKGPTLVAIALIIALGWGGTHVVDTWAKAKEAEVEASTKIKEKEIDAARDRDREQARTEQFELIGSIAKQNAAVGRFDKATEEGARSIVKGASDADHIRVGRVTFDRAEIIEVNQRAVRDRAEAKIVTDEFYVVRIEFRHTDTTRVWLASSNYDEFPALILSDDLPTAEVDKIIEAARARQSIKLEVSLTYIRNQIRAAQVLSLKGTATDGKIFVEPKRFDQSEPRATPLNEG